MYLVLDSIQYAIEDKLNIASLQTSNLHVFTARDTFVGHSMFVVVCNLSKKTRHKHEISRNHVNLNKSPAMEHNTNQMR